MLNFDNHEYDTGPQYFNPGTYLCKIVECKYIEFSSDQRPAFIVEFSVLDVIESESTSNKKGSSPSWVDKPGKFPKGREVWMNNIAGFWAAVKGFDRTLEEDSKDVVAATADGTLTREIASVTDEKIQSFQDALVIVKAYDKRTKSGGVITKLAFDPAKHGETVFAD